MLKGGYEARPYDIHQPIFLRCDICGSIVGQGMFLSVWGGGYLQNLRTEHMLSMASFGKGQLSNDILLLGSDTSCVFKIKDILREREMLYTLIFITTVKIAVA